MTERPWITRQEIVTKAPASIVPQCNGGCCEGFALEPLEDTRKEAMQRLSEKIAAAVTDAGRSDITFIADMVIPLAGDGERNLFTCRHYDTTTHLCTVYDQRPNMCRIFPRKGKESCACQRQAT